MEPQATAQAEQNASNPAACILRMREAINRHDLDALTDCFASDYQSEFPAHLGRTFRGHAQMRANWAQIFSSVPDIHADLIRVAVQGETVWSEWDWQGTRVDGTRFWQRGVTLQGVQNGRVEWVRLYMEPVQTASAGGAVPQSLIGPESGESLSTR